MAGKTHAIIGDGLTAAEFAKTIRLPSGSLLYVIGPAVGQVGRGLAYADTPDGAVWKDAYLLNSPSEGVDPVFAEWMCANWDGIAERMAGRQPDWLKAGADYIDQGDFGALNAPRAIFGDYVVSKAMEGFTRQREQGVEVRQVAACAMDLQQVADGFAVRLSNGETLMVDSVDIAPGGPGNQHLFDADGDRAFSRLYGNEEAIIARLQTGGALLCLGSNAAMLDALRLCQATLPEREVRLIALSPSARLPEPLVPTMPRKTATLNIEGPFESADALVAAVAARMAQAREAGHSMASIRGPFKAALQRIGLAKLVPDQAEARKVLPQFDRLFLRGTRDSLMDFHRLKEAGQVRILAGRLVTHKSVGEELSVTIQLTSGEQEQLTAAAMLNCAGPGRQPVYDPLTDSLLSRGWLRKCPVTGGIEVGDGLQAGRPGLRYLSPTVSVIGGMPLAFSLYDASDLKQAITLSNDIG